MKMGLREANQNFSKAIKAVKAGKVICAHGKGHTYRHDSAYPKAATVEDAIGQLEQEGVLRPNLKAGVIRDNWKPLSIRNVSLSRAVRELRDEE